MKKSKREVKGKGVEVIIYPELIDYRWESLSTPANDLLFGVVIGENLSINLVTDGKVSITDRENNFYSNNCVPQDFIELIRSGIPVEDTDYTINSNNWFSVFFVNKDKEVIEDIVFEAMPKNEEELIECLLQYFEWGMENL